MIGKGRKIGIFVLGGGLLVALVVTMVRISGPASESSGKRGLLKREAILEQQARSIEEKANQRFSPAGGPPVFQSPELRFDGQVLRIPVSNSWQTLSLPSQKEALSRISAAYVGVWQMVMKSHHEPAIVFLEAGRRVALHTQIDHWVASPVLPKKDSSGEGT